jgi:hypothetical protein
MLRIMILFVLFFSTLPLEAQVYRCDTPEGTIYSQMPCAENAERLPEFDPVVEAETGPGAEMPGLAEDAPVAKQPTAMENFISTLEKQRDQQFGTIDANVRTLQEQLDATGENAPDERAREMLERELATLATERVSIREQYASLISEALDRAESGRGVD